MLDLIIKNGSCYIDRVIKNHDIAIKNGKIIKIGKIDGEAKKILDAKNLTILPGCIDTQTHLESLAPLILKIFIQEVERQ